MKKLLLIIGFLSFTSSSQADSPLRLVIDPSISHQVIRGFGGSGAWHDDEYLRYSEEERRAFTDFLFDPEKGIGLHIYRTRVFPDAMGEERSEPFNWNDRNIVAIGTFCKEIDERYDLTLKAAPWTPPDWMKTNKSSWGGSLEAEFYGAYADYLVTTLSGMKERYGIAFDVLSVQNESDSAKRWDSCVWSAEQLTVFTRDHLLPALEKANLTDVKLMVNEDTTWTDKTINEILEDPVLAENIDIAAAHQYWRGHRRERIKPFEKAKDLGLDVWMTEFYYGDYLLKGRTHDEDGAQEIETPATFTELDRTLSLARIQHDALTRAEVNAWLFWWVFSTREKNVQALISANQNFKETEGQLTGFTIHKWAYGLGQYSKFVRPGSVRIQAEIKGAPEEVMISAYRRPDKRLVLVAVNLSGEPLKISSGGAGVGSWSVYRTSETENLALVKVQEAESFELAPRSITSFLSAP